MSTVVAPTRTEPSCYAGLRMTAEEYLHLEADEARYELVDGVVVMSPSPSRWHQETLLEICRQLANYLAIHPLGKAYPEVDIQLTPGPDAAGLVYRPEVVFLRNKKLGGLGDTITGVVPDLVVEIVSPTTRRYDNETKRDDYERAGVHEYWIVDPDRRAMTFLRHDGTKFTEATASPSQFTSEAVEGFTLDLDWVRKTFRS